MLITPEDGSGAFYATLTLADNPTVVGTPLNAANLLSQATAALYGLGAAAVPDDVLAQARTLITEIIFGTYTGNAEISRTIDLGFKPKALFLEDQRGKRAGTSGAQYGGLALPDFPVTIRGRDVIRIVENGFSVGYDSGYIETNVGGIIYRYIAFK